MKCQIKLVFNVFESTPYITSELSYNKTRISWKYFLAKVIEVLKNKGFTFNHIAEMDIVTIANKMDKSYEIYLKHRLHAIE